MIVGKLRRTVLPLLAVALLCVFQLWQFNSINKSAAFNFSTATTPATADVVTAKAEGTINSTISNSITTTSPSLASNTTAATNTTIMSATTTTNSSSRNKEENEETRRTKAHLLAKRIFHEQKPWKNASLWHTVSRNDWKAAVQNANTETLPIVETVYKDCDLYLMPNDSKSSNTTATNKNAKGGNERQQQLFPRIQFQCGGDDEILRDEPCRTANVCRVVFDEQAWGIPNNNQRKVANNANSKSTALLMMVDGLGYLTGSDVFPAFLNKASYAYRSNRTLYIWIGHLDQNLLYARNDDNEVLQQSFGYVCAPKETTNSMHYYKPIAFLVLFEILLSQQQEQSAQSSSSKPNDYSNSFFFLDADTDFTTTAFERIHQESDNDANTTAIGPEDYFALSPQASIVATQNVQGRVLMNSGLMFVRDTRWARELSSLWWYTRCGHKDQLALWLVLFASFSAWTTSGSATTILETNEATNATTNTTTPPTTPPQFSYPGQIFYNYDDAINKLLMHFRKRGHIIRSSWKQIITEDAMKDDADDDYDFPRPSSNIVDSYSSEGSIPRILQGHPLELPHVLILPQSTIQLLKPQQQQGKTLPRLKMDDGNDSFVAHSKKLHSCSDGRCWPYWIE